MSVSDSKVHDGAGGPPLQWYQGLSGYQWFVLIVATLGWLFDTMDQQFFNLARNAAMIDLLGVESGDPLVKEYGGYATSIFLVGWAIGGVIFGVLGDRYGRARTLVLTILLYSCFTGLSALSQNFFQFAVFRFITGLGVGGAFAAGVTLVAEVMPDRSRTYALGSLQAFSAVGNITAALIAWFLGYLAIRNLLGPYPPWRIEFVIGALPAFLAIFIMWRLEEPERWKQMAAERAAGKIGAAGSIPDLFKHPTWRRNTIVGLILSFSGVVAVWGIGFFSFDLASSVFTPKLTAQALADGMTKEAADKFAKDTIQQWVGIISLVQNTGAFFGIYAFAYVSDRIGRRPTFGIFFVLAAISTAAVFGFLNEFWHIFVLIPIMGFCQLALFGGYAIYFPELFPTRLRSTGVSFCYNVGRLVAALGPLTLGLLTSRVYDGPDRFRYAGMTMCLVLFVGLLALPFAPETRRQPLPEETH